jgi:hypothetical protein
LPLDTDTSSYFSLSSLMSASYTGLGSSSLAAT